MEDHFFKVIPVEEKRLSRDLFAPDLAYESVLDGKSGQFHIIFEMEFL
jgi:hypothetical protein